MSTRCWRRVAAAALLPGVLAVSAPITAEEQADPESAAPTAIEEVIVTATKRETDLMATPLAVSAVSQDRLTEQGVADVTGLGDLVPNMQVGSSPSDSGVQVTVRGITSNNFTELGDPTVAIHVDGMYSPRPQAGLALLHDVERVEILRGPQGTLFGRNSTSGSINIVTARPQTDALDGAAEFDLGSFNRTAARGWFNLPANDRLAFRASAMVERADSYIDQAVDDLDLVFDVDGDGNPEIPADGIPNTDQRRSRPVDDAGAYFAVDRWAARLAMRAYLSDTADWQITYDYFLDRSPGGLSLKDCEKASGTFFACDHDQWYARVNVPGDKDFTIGTFRSEFTWDVTDGVVMEYRFARSLQQRFQQYDGDAGAFVDPEHPGYGIQRFCCGAGPLVRDAAAFEQFGFPVQVMFPFEDLQLTTRDSTYRSSVHELQFKSAGSADLAWIAGAFAMREKNAIRFDVELPFCCGGGIPLAQSFLQPDRQVNTRAIFAQTDYAVTEDLNFTLGYRHTWDRKSDSGGSNHSTIGYWVNPGLYDPSAEPFWYESWGLIGVDPNWPANPAFYQADKLTPAMGSLAEDFPERIPGTDNSYQADWGQGTWRLGFDYLANNDLFVYGYMATGFKAGGFGDKVDVCECGEVTAFPYDPEEVTAWEFGVKAELLDGNLKLLANTFLNDYADMQRTSWVIVGESAQSGRDIGTLLTTNLAQADIFGIELEWDWAEPWQGGRVFGWVSLPERGNRLAQGRRRRFVLLRARLSGAGSLSAGRSLPATGRRRLPTPCGSVRQQAALVAGVVVLGECGSHLVAGERLHAGAVADCQLAGRDVLQRRQLRRRAAPRRSGSRADHECEFQARQRAPGLGGGCLRLQRHRRAGAILGGPGARLLAGQLLPAAHLRPALLQELPIAPPAPARPRASQAMRRAGAWLALGLALPAGAADETGGPVPVRIVAEDGRYTMLRGGQPYLVKGAGAAGVALASVAARGGNSIRTWGIDMARMKLDAAHRHGLTVAMGLPVAAERFGFDYAAPDAVAAQRQAVRDAVLRYKDHPALLAWIIGNELDHGAADPRVYDEVDALSRMIHDLDPNHPTTTAIAGLDPDVVKRVRRRAPDLDFLSLQLYGGLAALPSALALLDGTPFLITEWGPIGHWEVERTPWGAPIEQDSAAKARRHIDGYRRFIEPHLDQGFGAYVFLWGQKQERTPTWYSLFTPTGEATAAVDAMQHLWTGRWPDNRAPTLRSLRLDGRTADSHVTLVERRRYTAVASVADPDGDAVAYQWNIKPESTSTAVGGDPEAPIDDRAGLIDDPSRARIELLAPSPPGAYRLFVYAYDGHGHAAHANIPFLVRPVGE